MRATLNKYKRIKGINKTVPLYPKDESIIKTTYQKLVKLRDDGKLIVGKFYQITDYICTTTQENTKARNNQFDIILPAISKNKLAEEGYATEHEIDDVYDVEFSDNVIKKCYVNKIHTFNDGTDIYHIVDCNTLLGYPTSINDIEFLENKKIKVTYSSTSLNKKIIRKYFDTSNLSAWKVWYCLDNDNTRFCWADTENGKGVIYRLIDEYNNDLPYDFKNILFLRYRDSNGRIYNTNAGGREEVWCYTFTVYSTGDAFVHILTVDEAWDLSIFGNLIDNGISGRGYEEAVVENKIGSCIIAHIEDVYTDTDTAKPRYALGNNVMFLADYFLSDNGGTGCYSYNKIGNNFTNNTINLQYSFCNNIIGNSCNDNMFDEFSENIIGNKFEKNDFSETSVCNALMGSDIYGFRVYSNTNQAANFIIESGVSCVLIQSNSATNKDIKNFTISSGLKGSSLTSRKIINHDPSNNDKHITYVPTGSSQIEV